MSNQVGDCFKFLWSFQNVRTLQPVNEVSIKQGGNFPILIVGPALII